MRFCRYDDDRYGVVQGDKVHDITAIVEKVLAAHKRPRWGDPMITHLDEVRKAVGDVSALPSKPVSSVKLLSPTAHCSAHELSCPRGRNVRAQA
jgi:hypothetical protein